MLIQKTNIYFEVNSNSLFIVYDDDNIYIVVLILNINKLSIYHSYIRLCKKIIRCHFKPKVIYFSFESFEEIYNKNINWIKENKNIQWN